MSTQACFPALHSRATRVHQYLVIFNMGVQARHNEGVSLLIQSHAWFTVLFIPHWRSDASSGHDFKAVCHCSSLSSSTGRSPVARTDSSTQFEWRSPDEAISQPFESDLTSAVSVASQYDLCLSGDALHTLQQRGLDTIYVPLTQVRRPLTQPSCCRAIIGRQS